jgi:SAM-dependent methyltransferase
LQGRLPDGNIFAGQAQAPPLPGGALWRCANCHFTFRSPLLPPALYESLYRAGGLGIWEGEYSREDFRLIRQWIDRNLTVSIDVLDVGCYTGELLGMMPPSFRRHGVEPNVEASRVAASRGVDVVAETVESLANLTRRFDLITACDVIEHVPNPLSLLSLLASRLTPSGHLLITTGNCDAWLWRVLGSDYWYCRFPEHIRFIGARWVAEMSAKAGLRPVDTFKFNYRGGFISVPRIGAAILHKMNPDLYRALRGRRATVGVGDTPPGCGAIRDHILCVLAKS